MGDSGVLLTIRYIVVARELFPLFEKSMVIGRNRHREMSLPRDGRPWIGSMGPARKAARETLALHVAVLAGVTTTGGRASPRAENGVQR